MVVKVKRSAMKAITILIVGGGANEIDNKRER